MIFFQCIVHAWNFSRKGDIPYYQVKAAMFGIEEENGQNYCGNHSIECQMFLFSLRLLENLE